jgi:hypothetical protein
LGLQPGWLEGGRLRSRFSSDGGPLASEFQVNSYTTDSQRHASVAADADGDFVVAWDSLGQDGSRYGVFARRFSSAGTPCLRAALFERRCVFGQRVSDQCVHRRLAGNSDGGDGRRWRLRRRLGGLDGILRVVARRFSSAGGPVASEFQVNSRTFNEQFRAAVAAADAGTFVIAWNSFGQDGWQGGVFAQRFGIATPTATATATSTVTPTATATPTSTPTPTSTLGALYEIPTLSGIAMAIESLVLLGICLAFLRRRSRLPSH